MGAIDKLIPLTLFLVALMGSIICLAVLLGCSKRRFGRPQYHGTPNRVAHGIGKGCRREYLPQCFGETLWRFRESRECLRSGWELSF